MSKQNNNVESKLKMDTEDKRIKEAFLHLLENSESVSDEEKDENLRIAAELQGVKSEFSEAEIDKKISLFTQRPNIRSKVIKWVAIAASAAVVTFALGTGIGAHAQGLTVREYVERLLGIETADTQHKTEITVGYSESDGMFYEMAFSMDTRFSSNRMIDGLTALLFEEPHVKDECLAEHQKIAEKVKLYTYDTNLSRNECTCQNYEIVYCRGCESYTFYKIGDPVKLKREIFGS